MMANRPINQHEQLGSTCDRLQEVAIDTAAIAYHLSASANSCVAII